MTDGAGATPPMTVLNPTIEPPNPIGSNLNDPIMTDAAAADARAAVDPATAGMQAFVSSMQGFVQQLQQSMEAAGLPAHIVVEGGGGAGIGGGLAAFAALIEEGERLREMSGRRVVLQNLTQRRRWNGQLATVRGVDAGRRLLVVELDEGHPDAADDEGGDDGDEGEASGRRVALRLEKVRLATPFDELPPAEAVAAALEADDPDALESALARAVAAGVDLAVAAARSVAAMRSQCR